MKLFDTFPSLYDNDMLYEYLNELFPIHFVKNKLAPLINAYSSDSTAYSVDKIKRLYNILCELPVPSKAKFNSFSKELRKCLYLLDQGCTYSDNVLNKEVFVRTTLNLIYSIITNNTAINLVISDDKLKEISEMSFDINYANSIYDFISKSNLYFNLSIRIKDYGYQPVFFSLSVPETPRLELFYITAIDCCSHFYFWKLTSVLLKYPRVYVNSPVCDVCKVGQMLDISRMLDTDSRYKVCICNRYNNCSLKEEATLNTEFILKAFLYSINAYMNRSIDTINVISSNNTNVERVATSNVYLSTSANNLLVPIYTTTNQNNKNHITDGKHSTHSSPREHFRQGCIRHYKSGKTAIIASTIVNKGSNNKSIYEAKGD